MGTPLISLDEALSGVTALGIDTAPFIYLIEMHPAFADRVRAIFGRVDAGALQGFSSTITLTEVLTAPRQAGDDQLAAAYRRLLLNSRNFTLLPIDADIADRAADLRARYRLRTPDALQLAAALAVGCQAFLTNDAGLRRIAELRVIFLQDVFI